MPQMARTPEAIGMEAIRLIQRLATGTESGSSSREHFRSWRSAWHCSAAVGSVAAATVPGAARIDRHTHRITADHQVRVMVDHRGSCSPAAVGRTHPSATRVQLHHAHKDILSRASRSRQVPRCAGAPPRLPNPRVGLSPSRRHVTTRTTLARVRLEYASVGPYTANRACHSYNIIANIALPLAVALQGQGPHAQVGRATGHRMSTCRA